MRAVSLRKMRTILHLFWLIIIAFSLLWNWHRTNQMAIGIAKEEARATFNKDLIYRMWNASHGGLYAPITPKTQPNPNLAHIHERDIQTPSGRQLTLINPAYMLRQVHELGSEKYGFRGHITSLNPIRPQNEPDPWEKKALESFERGNQESVELADFEDGQYLRFMRPVIAQEGCLTCHGEQGYQVGDIRGGISVSVPMAAFRSHASVQFSTIAWGHLLFYVLGAGGIVWAMTKRRHMEATLQASRNTLSHLNQQLDSTAQTLSQLMERVVTQKDLNIRFDNQSLLKCWEVKNCDKTSCPVHGNTENLRCWEVAGTFCTNQGPYAQKLEDCRKCEIYQNSRETSLLALGETFNEMMAMLESQRTELNTAIEDGRLLNSVLELETNHQTTDSKARW